MKQGWEIKKLGEVCDIICGQDYKSVKDDNGKYPIYGTGGIMGYASQYRCPANSVIIGRKGSINNPLFVETEFWNVDTAFGVVPNETILHPKFFYLFCKDYDFTRHDVSVTIPSLRRTDILKINVPVPPIAEQEKIVAELDCLSGIIEKKKQQLKELDNLAQSIFYEMFGDPVENDKGWETAKLKDSVVEMFLGPFGSALKTECYVDKDASYCMVYEQKHAIRKTLNLETHYINQSKYNELKRFEVHSGDFIMSCRGTIGEIYRLPNDAPMGIIHPSVMKIRIKEDIYNPIFFNRLLSRIIKNETTSGNCVQMAITAKELGARKPILPPLKIQQDFASKIESIEKQKELIAQSIKETETLFNSRMDYYFN